MANFAITGVAGYIAPRHLEAIHATGGNLVAAYDPCDSVGVLDRYFPEAAYFKEFEVFDRHVEYLRRIGETSRVHYVSICSPNYLHDAQARFALRIGADAVCEKPLVLNPWNLDALQAMEAEHNGENRVWCVLQLRHHPALVALRAWMAANPPQGNKQRRTVELKYVTPRGKWYPHSWKGKEELSGGLLMNIGIHLFDMLLWLFGPAHHIEMVYKTPKSVQGKFELETADVEWHLSINKQDLPAGAPSDSSYRQLVVDDKPIEFSKGFTDLHTRVYHNILRGKGLGIDAVRPSINLVYALRHLNQGKCVKLI
jgi:UDP-N-acetyl-2-amino-2-deoxyglucuronate dehydrogenase